MQKLILIIEIISKNKGEEVKMKKFIMIVMAIICFAFCFFGCSNTNKEELSSFEKEIVGEWVLKDAKQMKNVGEYNYYPNGSADFNSIVNGYYNKATLVFYEEKSNGQIKGELKINNDITTFYWTRTAKKVISLENPLYMNYSSGVGKKSGKIDTIFISDDLSYINIMFVSAKVFYYFEK